MRMGPVPERRANSRTHTPINRRPWLGVRTRHQVRTFGCDIAFGMDEMARVSATEAIPSCDPMHGGDLASTARALPKLPIMLISKRMTTCTILYK